MALITRFTQGVSVLEVRAKVESGVIKNGYWIYWFRVFPHAPRSSPGVSTLSSVNLDIDYDVVNSAPPDGRMVSCQPMFD